MKVKHITMKIKQSTKFMKVKTLCIYFKIILSKNKEDDVDYV